MYAIGQRVWVKPVGRLARIKVRRWGLQGPPPRRLAIYEVEFVDGGGQPKPPGNVYDTTHLRAADGCCDGCNRWLPRSSFNGGAKSRDGEYDYGLSFCFLCVSEESRSPILMLYGGW